MPKKGIAIDERFIEWQRLLSAHPRLLRALRLPEASDLRADAIKRASEALGLDAESPIDRSILLGILAETHFPPTAGVGIRALKGRPSLGAPIKWTQEREQQLIRIVRSVYRGAYLKGGKKHPSIPQIAKLIVKSPLSKGMKFSTAKAIEVHLRDMLKSNHSRRKLEIK
jgi:hypothetical protein